MIHEVETKQEKQALIRRVLEALPDWFGIPEAIEEYVENGSEMRTFAAECNGESVGFVCWLPTSASAAEVHVMGILPAYRHKGLGRALISACEEACRRNHLPLLHVKTVDDGAGYASYRQTTAFYRAMGFLPLQVLPLWDENNPCLLLVKCVGDAPNE